MEDLDTTQEDDPSAGDLVASPAIPTPEIGQDTPAASADVGSTTEDADSVAAAGEVDEDLDDETIDAFLEAYKGRILTRDPIKSELTRQIQEEVARRVDEAERVQQSESTINELRQQGQRAVGALANQFKAAQVELNRIAQVVQSGDTNALTALAVRSDVLNSDSFGADLRSYGAAVAGHVKDTYERALEIGFEDVFSNDLPAVNDEQAEELKRIINTFQRMEGDIQQADKAVPYYFRELLKFVSKRAKEAGAMAAQKSLESRKGLKDKISSQNAVAAAKAKLERDRQPPTTAPSRSTDIAGMISMDTYRQALADARKGVAGAKERADAIVQSIATRQSLGTPT